MHLLIGRRDSVERLQNDRAVRIISSADFTATDAVALAQDQQGIFDALSAGATGYLLKHTRRDALIKALREVHSGGSPMTSNIARMVVQALYQTTPKTKASDLLSARQNEVLSLLAQGYLYKEIAATMNISLPTVNTYIRRIYEKLQVQSRGQAVALYADLHEKRH